MAARDPRTGQFVSSSAADEISFAAEDLDYQHIATRAEFRSDIGSGDNLFDPWTSWEPLGGLTRDELAELVLLVVRAAVSTNDSAGNDKARVTTEWELSSQSSVQMIDPDDPGNRQSDVDGVTGLDRADWDVESDPDILDHWNVSATVMEDETDGVGLADRGDYFAVHPLRQWYGRGPVYDRHSELFLHMWEQIAGSPQVDMEVRISLAWDVFDRS